RGRPSPGGRSGARPRHRVGHGPGEDRGARGSRGEDDRGARLIAKRSFPRGAPPVMMAVPMRRLWLAASVLGVAAVVAGPVVSARAAPHAPGVTLRLSSNVVTFGQYVRFSGHISPRTGGQTVDVVDGKGHRLARATTTSNGS